MSDIEVSLRKELCDAEYSEGYSESFVNTYIATQIKVIREQRKMTQAELAGLIGTTQAGVSRYENVNYSSWNVKTLTKLARAFGVWLKVSFEPFGELPNEVVQFSRQSLERVKREDDPGLSAMSIPMISMYHDEGPKVIAIDSRKKSSAYGDIGQRNVPSWNESSLGGQNDSVPKRATVESEQSGNEKEELSYASAINC
jgi:transcriptional regulator with XRE-family HTH domain